MYYFYMNTNIYGDFQICIIEHLRKFRVWIRTQPNAQCPCNKWVFRTNCQILHKGRYQGFLVLSRFDQFFYFLMCIFRNVSLLPTSLFSSFSTLKKPIPKNIIACLFSAHNIISWSCHDQVRLRGYVSRDSSPIIGEVSLGT